MSGIIRKKTVVLHYYFCYVVTGSVAYIIDITINLKSSVETKYAKLTEFN